VLQVSPWCEPEVIQAAYRALARTRHPDVNRSADAEEQMRRLNVAYQTLSDPVQRMRYDEELALEVARPVPIRPASAPVDPLGGRAPASPTPIRPRPSAAPHATSAPVSHGASSAASTSPSAYQPSIFDAGGNMLLPRSAIYVSLVMVTVILALVAWLILDTLAQRPSVPARVQHAHEGAWSPAFAWSPVDQATVAQPGLSLSGARWNE
jgi:hypothetical protein